jgi:hypothetical protein
MAPKKRPGEKWFMPANATICEEYETPPDDTFVPKDGLVLFWSVQVVKGAQFKILFVVKVGTVEESTWTPILNWEVASIQAMDDYLAVMLQNSSNENVHMFMHQFSEPFDVAYAKETCVEPDIIKPEAIFIDNSVVNTKVASRFLKLKNAVTAANKALQSKEKKPAPPRRGAPTEEGAGSSRPLSLRKPKPVPADSRRTSTTTTPADSQTTTPSGSRQNTPSKRSRESSVMTDEAVSPELRMPKKGEVVNTKAINAINEAYEAKIAEVFFMGREYKFPVDIAQCHQTPPEKCVRAMEEDYVKWIVTKMIAGAWKGDKQTIVLMPQGLKKKPTPDLWPNISQGDFWIIDGQYSIQASKNIQLDDDVPQKVKDRVKTWEALVVWSDNDGMLCDISRYFNSLNKIKAYQASWIQNIIASRDVWEHYGRPARERDNARDKNPKWEVSIVLTKP